MEIMIYTKVPIVFFCIVKARGLVAGGSLKLCIYEISSKFWCLCSLKLQQPL